MHTLFARVGGIVRQYGLKESFLEMIENYNDYHPTTEGRFARVRAKADFVPPLFCLLTKQEYRLTISIMNKGDNPYLMYASSPDELLLSKPLFSKNRFLQPEVLTRHHFETLLLREFERGPFTARGDE
jgi:hypothetical protein